MSRDSKSGASKTSQISWDSNSSKTSQISWDSTSGASKTSRIRWFQKPSRKPWSPNSLLPKPSQIHGPRIRWFQNHRKYHGPRIRFFQKHRTYHGPRNRCFQNHRKNHDRENHGPRIRWFQKHRKYTMVPEFAGSKTIANQTSAVMQPCKCIHLSKRIHFGCKESTAWSQRTANRCFRAIPLLVLWGVHNFGRTSIC